MGNRKKDALMLFNRNNILEAAKRLFLLKGIHQTTMDEIAKEADYSKSTIYVYFKSKEEIYNYIIYENMKLLKQAISINTDLINNNYKQCFFDICNTLASFQEASPLFFESILGEISINPEDFIKYPILLDIYNEGESINVIVSNYLEIGITKHYLLSTIDPLLATFTLWASICGVITLADKKKSYIQDGLKSSKQEFLNQSFLMLWSSICNKEESK